jgi:hypothetical protein
VNILVRDGQEIEFQVKHFVLLGFIVERFYRRGKVLDTLLVEDRRTTCGPTQYTIKAKDIRRLYNEDGVETWQAARVLPTDVRALR